MVSVNTSNLGSLQGMPDVEFEEVQFFTAPDDGRALYLFRQRATAPRAP